MIPSSSHSPSSAETAQVASAEDSIQEKSTILPSSPTAPLPTFSTGSSSLGPAAPFPPPPPPELPLTWKQHRQRLNFSGQVSALWQQQHEENNTNKVTKHL
jgi:hypothetical protein